MRIYYIDPGTGSMLISAIIAMLSVVFFVVKGIVYRTFGIGGDKGESVDLTKNYGMLFYSEGKQYWNVFKPLIEESSRRGIKVTYFTSDEEDPGLKVNLPHVTVRYIGSGREAFYILNRIKADVVIMTTPGLDVLELKRSPNVKYYVHIIHSAGSIAGYKAYAVDYFDSVLLGGYGDIDVIRELEAVRNLPKKELEIIGHTYLDVLREKSDEIPNDFSFFDNKRPTVLISPTWSNHGLLMKYGEEILTPLVESDKFNIILRAHPQSFISEKEMIDDLMNKFPNSKHLVWDREIDNIYAMSQADIMISDFSGIIFDFYTLYKKPILTMHGNYEQRGRDVSDLNGPAWDLQMIEQIGGVINEEDVSDIHNIVFEVLKNNETAKESEFDIAIMDKYPGESAVRGMDYLEQKLEEIQTETKSLEISNESYIEEVEDVHPTMRRTIKKYMSPNMLFQFMLGAIILTGLIYTGSILLPETGLNQVMFSLVLPYAVALTGVIFLLFIFSVRINGKGKMTLTKITEPFNIQSIFLIALPLTPILQYIISNQDILDFSSSLKVFIFFSIISLIMIVLLPWLMSSVVQTSVSTAISVSFLFILFNRASFGRTTRMLYILMLLVLLCIVIFLMLEFDKQKVLLIIFAIFLGTNTMVTFLNHDVVVEKNTTVDSSAFKLVESTKALVPKRTPDVILMTYDAYSNEETWKQYGYDNSPQMKYLLDEGFTIYDGSYSVTAQSLPSMSHVLHPQKTSFDNAVFRQHISGDASSLEMFRMSDYIIKSIFTSDYFTTGAETNYDFSYPGDRYSINPDKIIINAILEGEFRFDADFSTLTYDDYLEAKDNQLRAKDKEPVFMYFHDDYPGHTQNSGVLLPGEREMILERLEMANFEMKKNIDALKTRNNDAIIIIVGDHGPYLTKNGTSLNTYDKNEIDRLDIQDRFGTFLAIKWPENDYAEKYDIRLIQDVMPAVAAYIYDDEELFDKNRMERIILTPNIIGGVEVKDGIIYGGIDDQKPLFENTGVRKH